MKINLFRRGISLLLVLCMALGLALGCTACGGAGGVAAATMFLRKTEGTVAVADAEGADIAPAENLGLYSGYTVGTEAESYAWIDLDQVKLAKLDENSAAAITKDGKNLSVDITAGSMFFNVTEPLAEDETMEIRTSSMLVGIRGTCGWVEVPDSGTMRVYILEGKVECIAGENTATVNAGEMATMNVSGEVTVKEFTALSVPDFVAQEVETDEVLKEAVLAASGIDAAGNPLSGYAEVFRQIEAMGKEILFAEEFDFEADGSPELLEMNTGWESSDTYAYEIHIYRKGAEQVEEVFGMSTGTGKSGDRVIALAESGGRLYVMFYFKSRPNRTCYGSIAQNDGGSDDWGMTESFSADPVRSGSDELNYRIFQADSPGPGGTLRGEWKERITAGEFEAEAAKYTVVRILLED